MRLEERLHREAVGLVRRLLPRAMIAPRRVPGDAVPVIEQVRDVEELRRADQLRRLDLVAAQLLDAALDGVAVLGVLVLDDADRHAVDDEHHVGAVALAGGRLELPLPCDVKDVGVGMLEIDQLDAAVTLLVLVVPLPLATQPRSISRLPSMVGGMASSVSMMERMASVGQPRIELARAWPPARRAAACRPRRRASAWRPRA